MFLAMMLVLPLHWVAMIFKIHFPGYKFRIEDEGADTRNDYFNFKPESSSATSIRMYFILAIPAIFLLIANALMMIGLQYLDVSIHQTLRGSLIIFVALLKEYVLKHHLLKFHWVGVFWNMVSVVFVGVAALLASYGGEEGSKDVTTTETVLGVGLTLFGTLAQASASVTEEHVMKMDDDPAPPLLVTGMIGFWGTVLCVVIIFPLAYWLPGDDHGSYEDPFSTWGMVTTPTLALILCLASSYNICAMVLIFEMSSVWHAMVDNFRPIAVWARDDGSDSVNFFSVNDPGLSKKSLLSDKARRIIILRPPELRHPLDDCIWTIATVGDCWLKRHRPLLNPINTSVAGEPGGAPHFACSVVCASFMETSTRSRSRSKTSTALPLVYKQLLVLWAAG
eukprot:scaffold40502_cov90-Cyclotella_meneghiniana.AAC.5